MEAGRFILKKALEFAKITDNTSVLFYYSDVEAYIFDEEFSDKDIKKIIVMKEDNEEEGLLEKVKTLGNIVIIPSVVLSRINKIKIALMMCISSGVINKGENLIALSGSGNAVDSAIFIDISKEQELLSFKGDVDVGKSVQPEVFERVLRIALELANQGREGKSVGAIFVLGDKTQILENTKQMIFNPFKGYEPDDKNILKRNLDDTLKEFSLLDGAIVINSDGVIETAGAYISTSSLSADDLPKGLGARHMAAAAITALTSAISVVVSESTGDVTIFKNGSIITRIEKVT